MIGWKRLADEPTEGEALLYALAAGALIWLAVYLYGLANKENRYLPPLEDKKDVDDEPSP
ncbi:MAG: hypothetical protein AUK35_10120 [Zetaproteobacteria bacterium CG2_30_46_52]|nr:MAG: hypothetical protein AUK35_10120 [Zetaproteobacteria bacterium CG2_30_46_52]